MKKKHPYLFPLLYGTALAAFTLYALLDTFVIARPMASVSQTAGIYANISAGASATEASANASADAAANADPANSGTSENTPSSEGQSRHSRPSRKKGSDTSSENDTPSNENQNSTKGQKTRPSSETRRDAEENAPASAATENKSPSVTGSNANENAPATENGSSSVTGSNANESNSAATVLQTFADENVNLTLSSYRIADTTVYVADVELTDLTLLKTAFANNTYGRNVTAKVSDTAASVGALLAINGDYYGAQERGYVIRNGVLYRSTAKSATQEDLVIYADGSFEIIREGDITAEELLANGAVQVLSFGPALVEDGEISVDANDEVGKAMASNPRTAIGILENGHYLFVVSDGRTSESEGLDLLDLAEFLKSLGCKTAYNLDGGGSSTMVFAGTLINNPTTSGNSTKERAVSDILYIG